MFQSILTGMEQMETRLSNNIVNEIKESETRINIKIENEVAKRIDSLFDGYKLVHESQWDLQRKLDKLEERVDLLEARIAG